LQIVKRSDAHRFIVLPKRWIVERTFAWISRNRRLARDFERYATTVAAFVRLAMIRIMLKRLTKPTLESAMHKTTTFEHGGKVYEVRAIPTLNGWEVRIFVEGTPANGFTNSVDSEVYQDAALDRVPEDSVAGLMETAERDFRGRACGGIGDLRKGY